MKHKYIYRGSLKFHVPNYTMSSYYISESNVNIIWDLKKVYLLLIKRVYVYFSR